MPFKHKFSFKEKLNITTEYLNGKIGFRESCRIYNINQQSLKDLIRLYNTFGTEGLKTGNTCTHYSDELKRMALGDYFNSCKSADAANLLKRCLLKKDLYGEDKKPVIRTGNGPQFISNLFEESYEGLNLYHERIPCRTPNKDAHIESFHSFFEDECIRIHEFNNFAHAYAEITKFMKRYNTKRLHSSLGYKAPEIFYELNKGEGIESMAIHL